MGIDTEDFNPEYDAAMETARVINMIEQAIVGDVKDRDDAIFVLKASLESLKTRLKQSLESMVGNAKIGVRGQVFGKASNTPSNAELQILLMQDIDLRKKQIKALGG